MLSSFSKVKRDEVLDGDSARQSGVTHGANHTDSVNFLVPMRRYEYHYE